MRSRLRLGPAAAFLTVLALGLIALVVWVATGRQQVQTLGVSVVLPVGVVTPGGPSLCQAPIALGIRAEAVEFNPGAPPPTSSLQVQLRAYPGGAVLGTGDLPGGFDPAKPQTVQLHPSVPGNREVSLCVRNTGPTPMGIFGSPSANLPCSLRRGAAACGFGEATASNSVTHASLGSQPLGGDMAAVFLDRHPSLGAWIDQTARNASVFKPGFVDARWRWWVLAGVLLVGVPALLALALRSLRADG